MQRKFIELFAGCGGLSLGLERAGFELLFANEISPMACETYAYNLLGEDLHSLAIENKTSNLVKWITSKYGPNELEFRLVENQQKAPTYIEGKGDLNELSELKNIEGKLLVGSVIELNKYLDNNKKLVKEIRSRNIDLVSGGPPCQSFSVAGLRQHDNHRNTLPMDFAHFVELVQPKIVLLENVSGILKPFQLPDGKHYAWFEVARVFASKGYYPLCLHVNAKNACVAQNRPRFIMIAFREDIFRTIRENQNCETLDTVMEEISDFYDKEKTSHGGDGGAASSPSKDLKYYDIDKSDILFETELFFGLNQCRENKKLHTAKEAIDDLRENLTGEKDKNGNQYLSLIEKSFPKKYPVHKFTEIQNRKLRKNSLKVKMRFKLLQHLSEEIDPSKSGFIGLEIRRFLKDPISNSLSEEAVNFFRKKTFLNEEGKSSLTFNNRKTLENYLSRLATKKHSLKALVANKPAQAALSIPDDACHYHKGLPRTLSIREMARIQSFPDWFVFRSKETTGGNQRKYEVPQYTQVGNAVPPLLGKALGELIMKALKFID